LPDKEENAVKKKFDIIEHTADIGIIAYGANMKELFANAAYAMFTLIADLETVKPTIEHKVVVEAQDTEGLLVSWLNELLYLVDVQRLIFNDFRVTELSDSNLGALAYGEPIDSLKHGLKAGVKAATYHMLEITKNDGYSAQIIFDA
jgi:SHS2 domain-containing protein